MITWIARNAGVLAACCAVLCFVPYVRVPSAVLLLCLLPGLAICRSWLKERYGLPLLLLGSLLSLCAVTAVAIPAALVAGRPSRAATVVLAALLTLLPSVWPRRRGTTTSEASYGGRTTRGWRWHLAVLAGVALLMQVGLSVAKYPGADTIRWKGLPDLMFFDGIYTQIALHTPPLDPENGSSLLVHNWIYHFHFALLGIVADLSVPAMQRLVSAWMALLLLGLVYLVAADLLQDHWAGVIACLFLMTSGEVNWLLRSMAEMGVVLEPLPWQHSPFGVTILFGWYNLPPLAAGLGAWYGFARHRQERSRPYLFASMALCVAMAFFHPVFYGVFMLGFCLWLISLWLREGPVPLWLGYLLTPLPFFLLYDLPYYGLALPPQVVDLDLQARAIGARVREMVRSFGALLVLGAAGIAGARGKLGPLPWFVGVSLVIGLLVRSPNPHWFNDLLYISLALASGLGATWLYRRARLVGVSATAGALAIGGVALALHLSAALKLEHTYSASERSAGEWLQRHTEPDDLVATLPNSTSSYTVLGLGKRRLVHGWTGHLLDFHHDAKTQEAEIAEIFTTSDPSRAAALAAHYRIDYLYLGPYEGSRAGGAGLVGECFPPAFTSSQVEIRAVTCPGDGPGAR